ncbi:Do family serine endopeptidase [Marivita sp. S0852]|uniref:Do family serine endopeptidase n=1 Tax=Marivita sp. S0852 TaxID=3373893 RepID=UPI003982CDA7
MSIAAAVAMPVTAVAQSETFPAPQDFSAMVQAKLPSVVGIIATGAEPTEAQRPRPQLPPGLEDFFGMPRPDAPPAGPRRALGSGFIISADGYVVTNNHVIEGASQIEVTIEDDQRITANLVGTDPATDIALLKVEDQDEAFPFVEWGDSRDLMIGEWVVAIGNPFGLGGTVTSGIVSAQSRNINSGPYDDFIQTDAAINSGNSGGPLFDAEGRVIGVNTAIYSPSGGSVGIGFAVPSHVAERIVDDLRDDGQVDRGWLGVQIQPVSDAIASALGLGDTSGALVNDVTQGGPAAEAGVQSGDVVLSVEGSDIADPRDLIFSIADLAIGQEASLTVWRDGQERELAVEIGRQPGSVNVAAQMDTDSDAGEPRLGASVAPLTSELRAQLGLPDTINGLFIQGVAPGSVAAQAGLSRGDVIVEIDNEVADSVSVVRDAMEAAQSENRPVLLRVYRGGTYQFIAVPTQDNDG